MFHGNSAKASMLCTINCPFQGTKIHNISNKRKPLNLKSTRTTRTPAFWDTPYCPMITHTNDSHQIPTQNKTKSKLQNFKNAKNSNLKILQETLHATHLLKLLDNMYKYEMDPTRTVGATERTRDAGRTEGRTDGRTEWNFIVCGVKSVSML